METKRSGMRATVIRLITLAALLEIILIFTRRLGDLRSHLVQAIVLFLLSSIVYIVCAYLVLQIERTDNSLKYNKLWLLIAAAGVVFRLTVWPLPPSLSDDLFRYRWEGKLQEHGGNPYQVRPNDPQWAHLRDETWDRVGSKDFKAGYGPLIELIQRWMYCATTAVTPDPYRQAFWFKFPFALFDLGVILALRALLRARGLPETRVLIYAWSPLPVMEFWASGHNDSAAVFFVVLALLAAAKERWTWAFGALTLAAAAKIWPLLLFPIFAGWNGRRPLRWYQWWVSVPILAVFCLPYWSDVGENLRFMSGFLGGWRNNDSLYGLLLWLTGDVYRAKYAAFAVLAGVVLFVTCRHLPLEKASLAAIAAMLMVSANCHPWYLTWILPLLAFYPVSALLLWTAVMPLAYEVLIGWTVLGEWNGSTPLRWWIYVPVYGLFLFGWLLRTRRRGGPSGPERPPLPIS
jgi:alpha-1,6-mannosyltransferase